VEEKRQRRLRLRQEKHQKSRLDRLEAQFSLKLRVSAVDVGDASSVADSELPAETATVGSTPSSRVDGRRRDPAASPVLVPAVRPVLLDTSTRSPVSGSVGGMGASVDGSMVSAVPYGSAGAAASSFAMGTLSTMDAGALAVGAAPVGAATAGGGVAYGGTPAVQTLAQMLRCGIEELWACNPNAALSDWTSRAAVVASAASLQPHPHPHAAAPDATHPHARLAGSLPRLAQAPRDPWDYPFPRPSSAVPRMDSTSTLRAAVPGSGASDRRGSGARGSVDWALDAMAIEMVTTAKGSAVPAFRWEPELASSASLRPDGAHDLSVVVAPGTERHRVVFRNSKSLGSLQRQANLAATTVTVTAAGGSSHGGGASSRAALPHAHSSASLRSGGGGDRLGSVAAAGSTSTASLASTGSAGTARVGDASRGGPGVDGGDSVFTSALVSTAVPFAGGSPNPFEGFGVTMIGDGVDPLAGMRVSKGSGVGGGARASRRMMEARLAGTKVSRSVVEMATGTAGPGGSGATATSAARASPTTPAAGASSSRRRRLSQDGVALLSEHAINSLLKDTRQTWQLRRESKAERRGRDDSDGVHGGVLPWRDIHDAHSAIRCAAAFLSGAVEPLAGEERGAFRVKTPPLATDPRPTLTQIMDATSFLADHRSRQLDRKDGYTTGVDLCKFEHTDGSHFCSSLFHHRVEADGSVVHYYLNDRMNELVREVSCRVLSSLLSP
jgi:hypothetical protein